MHFKSKNTTSLILAVTASLCSRAVFFFFNDPEGPNLLVVMGMAAIIYFVSLTMYLFKAFPTSFTPLQKLLLAIFVQILLATLFYFGLK